MSDETKPNELPTTADEVTTPIDITTDLLSDSTITPSVKRNIFKALDRLFCAAIDIPVGALDRRNAEKWVETEARIKIREGITAQTVGQMKVGPEYAQRAVMKYGGKILREQTNLDKICTIAVNLLKKEKSVNSIDQGVDSSKEQIINDDWFNSFEEEGRQISTKDMQLLFGRILAGKIRKPGGYSKRSVKILGQLDPDVAILFSKLCSICVVLKNPVDGSVFDARVPSLGGIAAQNALIKYGLGFLQLSTLNEYGLILSDYDSWYEYSLTPGNEIPPNRLLLWHQGRYWDLLTLPQWNQNQQQFRVSGVQLSRVGRELFSIVDQDPMENYTQELKKFFARQNLQMVEVPSQNKT